MWLDNGWVIDCIGGGRTASPRNQEQQLFRPPLRMLFICHRGTAKETQRQAVLLELKLMLGRLTFSAFSREKDMRHLTVHLYLGILREAAKSVCG